MSLALTDEDSALFLDYKEQQRQLMDLETKYNEIISYLFEWTEDIEHEDIINEIKFLKNHYHTMEYCE